MMKARTFFAAAALVALTLLSAGCKKHSYMEGGIVRFTVTTKPVATKTAYSGEVIDGVERIDWIAAASGVQGDKVAVVMLNNDGGRATDYQVTGVSSSSQKSIGTLTPVGEAFQWGEGNHDFYAIYPSPSVDASWSNNFFGWPGAFAGTLALTYPKNQVVTADPDNSGVYLPDMKYAYMFAQIEDVAPAGTVTLGFSPIYTAFEISISAGENEAIDLRGFRLICNDEDAVLACDMNVDLENELGFVESNTSNVIAVDFTQTGGPIRLTQDVGPIKFTVFTYLKLDADPKPKLSQLTLEFTGDQIGTRTLDLKQNGAWIEFDGGCKHKIYGLNFPKLDEGTAGGQDINWNNADGEDLNWNGAEGEDINWGGNKPYALPGKFSVSDDKQVQFSRGNLVYRAGEFDFHKRQYDRCFKENCTAEFGPNTTFDLFGWATAGIAGADETMVNYQPWSFNETPLEPTETMDALNKWGFGPSINNVTENQSWWEADPDLYAKYCDWGNNYTLRKNAGEGWYTMSLDEWHYLLSERAASTVNGIENARFALATVHGYYGVILFPDTFAADFDGDLGIFTASSINNSTGAGLTDDYAQVYEALTLTDAQWSKAEAAGLVFLAPAGGRDMENHVVTTMQLGSNMIKNLNYYWTSTAATSHGCYVIGLQGPIVTLEYATTVQRNVCIAVRLVKLAE